MSTVECNCAVRHNCCSRSYPIFPAKLHAMDTIQPNYDVIRHCFHAVNTKYFLVMLGGARNTKVLSMSEQGQLQAVTDGQQRPGGCYESSKFCTE
jgi:hypothetical protein